ncbi:MAG: tRNA-dihydrouridine synthase [Actinobacteria bacterium]|nr:tRNA-dihydrouridine synthase [Actinomycetota bacterium]
MAGVTNAAYRRLCRSYGAGLYVSEMISARALVEGNETTERMVRFDPDEEVRSIQLYVVDPKVAREAVRRVVEDDRVLVSAIVREAVRAAGSVPVTVKMRKGVDDRVLTYLETGRRAADEGAAAITLHARTAEQLYSGRADWDAIGALKEAVPSIPVLGNGDIWAAEHALQMMQQTGCDGVVIGRGCLGKPWLFRDLVDAFAGRPVQDPPTLGDVADVMRRHARLLVEAFRGEEAYAIRDFRKHVGWYLTGYPAGGVRRRELAMASSLAELDELLGGLDATAVLPPDAHRLPRGHSQGPKEVSLPEQWLATADDAAPPDEVYVSGG